jgi:hypothetical protein
MKKIVMTWQQTSKLVHANELKTDEFENESSGTSNNLAIEQWNGDWGGDGAVGKKAEECRVATYYTSLFLYRRLSR